MCFCAVLGCVPFDPVLMEECDDENHWVAVNCYLFNWVFFT